MFYKEIKDILNRLNSENIGELKPILTRKVNEVILNMNDDSVYDSELESLCNFLITREELRNELMKEKSLWNNLTRKLEDHYYLENLYEEEYNRLENFNTKKNAPSDQD